MALQLKLSPKDVLTSDLNARLSAVQFYATVLDRIDREGIPRPEGFGSFQEIHDIDYICQQSGGTEIFKERKPFSPYLESRAWEEAMTAYRVGNAIVVNRSFGYHPDKQTTILTIEGQSPDTDIIDKFRKYYCGEPQILQKEIIQAVEFSLS